MTYYITTSGMLGSTDVLEHHGILNQKCGVRRFQNYDGTLTEAGKIRYRKLEQRSKDAEDKYKKAVAHTPSRTMRWNDIGIYAYDKKMRKINSLHAKSERAKAEFEKFKELLGDEILNAKIDKNLPEKSKDEEVQREFNELPIEEQEPYLVRAAEKQFEDDVKSGLVDKINKSLARIDMSPLTKEDYVYEAIYGDGNEGRNAWKEYAKDRKNREGADKTEAPKQSAKSDKPEYIDKVETKNGDTRYFYDKDELKAYKDGRTGASDADLDKAFKKMRNTAKTGEEVDRREDAWDRARDKDLWDLNFLEAVQNSVALEKGDTKTLLTEYAYYLADPEQYLQDRDKYLKDY